MKDIDKPIDISARDPEFIVSLSADIPTSYRGVLNDDYNASLITPVKHYKVSNKKLIGAPGNDAWVFTVKLIALKVLTTFVIRLMYMRSWKLYPLQTVTLPVIID